VIVLDTNVVSAVVGGRAEGAVIAWLNAMSDDAVLTSITAAELRLGVALLPPGRRRERMEAAIEGMLLDDFDGAVLPFDERASRAYAGLVADRRRRGRPISVPDAQIAAICLSRDTLLATRNVSDFDQTGVTVVNPWET
jgi:toxin FitB